MLEIAQIVRRPKLSSQALQRQAAALYPVLLPRSLSPQFRMLNSTFCWKPTFQHQSLTSYLSKILSSCQAWKQATLSTEIVIFYFIIILQSGGLPKGFFTHP